MNKSGNEMVIAIKKRGGVEHCHAHPQSKNLCSKYGFTK